MSSSSFTIAVIGGRNFTDYDLLEKTLNGFQVMTKPITKIISGGAVGADSLAAQYANKYGIPLSELFPDWETYGKVAGLIRNGDIIHGADYVIAFWDYKSKGTRDGVQKAINTGRPLTIIKFIPTTQE